MRSSFGVRLHIYTVQAHIFAGLSRILFHCLTCPMWCHHIGLTLRRQTRCGSFCPATETEAIGVAVAGKPYNLSGHSDIEGAETVLVSYVDGGVFARLTAQNTANLDYLSAMTGIDLPNEEEEDEPQPDDAPADEYVEDGYDDTVDDPEYTDSDDEEGAE